MLLSIIFILLLEGLTHKMIRSDQQMQRKIRSTKIMLGHSQDRQYWTKPVNIAEENKLIEKQGKLKKINI